NLLDMWIVSRLHQLSIEVDKSFGDYDLPGAIKPILPFIDDASNWFVRRSRKRFWKTDNDTDKQDAYATLHYVLMTLSRIMAPITPFMSEALYRNLTGKESVHLTDWPHFQPIDTSVIEQMAQIRELITIGLSQRADAGIKVRQPLASAQVNTSVQIPSHLADAYTAILQEELNVKTVVLQHGKEPKVTIDTTLTDELLAEGMVRDVVRQVQSARKKADFNVEDRILCELSTPDKKLSQAIEHHQAYISKETLSSPHVLQNPMYKDSVTIGGATLTIALGK
ncbi:MAG TPA: class I tRNA ligase family protein, partial [Candidatus Saccharibacteria bacterium]|nr:class I tRNA ligase family protein [Candidatus Saccharibacteria bacterium]